MKRVVIEDGKKTVYHDLGDKVVIERLSDASAVIEANKRQMLDTTGRMGEFVHIGRVPTEIIDRWSREDGINYMAQENAMKLVKKLEERDNRLFKTHPGKFA